jgi:hypothetical protein
VPCKGASGEAARMRVVRSSSRRGAEEQWGALQEERQRQLVKERMVTLASKEARLRSQAEQLSRLTAEMQVFSRPSRSARLVLYPAWL